MSKEISAPQGRKDQAAKLQIISEDADIPLVERIQAKENREREGRNAGRILR
jgi:hypothetical protein